MVDLGQVTVITWCLEDTSYSTLYLSLLRFRGWRAKGVPLRLQKDRQLYLELQ